MTTVFDTFLEDEERQRRHRWEGSCSASRLLYACERTCASNIYRHRHRQRDVSRSLVWEMEALSSSHAKKTPPLFVTQSCRQCRSSSVGEPKEGNQGGEPRRGTKEANLTGRSLTGRNPGTVHTSHAGNFAAFQKTKFSYVEKTASAAESFPLCRLFYFIS